MPIPKSLRRIRIAQVRATAAAFSALARIPATAAAIDLLGKSEWIESALVGFRRGFDTREEAAQCVAQYGFKEHEHPDAIRRHLELSKSARPSDYAALFHLAKLLPDYSRLVDLGGNAGNLFYCYSRYLELPEDFRWVVVEIPSVAEAGAAIARERGEERLCFSTSLSDACAYGPSTILLISGALHYFEPPLGELLADAGVRPAHVLINRSPVSGGGTVIGIQDGGRYVTTARVLDRGTLIASMEQAGYRLQDDWIAAELNMRLPLRPSKSVESYSGFLFSREA